MTRPKNIVLLGATGTVGQLALEVINLLESCHLYAVTGWSNTRLLQTITDQYQPNFVASQYNFERPMGCQASSIDDLMQDPQVDMVFCAISGFSALGPIITAIRHGKDIAIANKEIIVAAGEIIMAEAKCHNVKIIPVDSEHSAIFQCLSGQDTNHIKRLILTGSGGPFIDLPSHKIANATVEQAIKHPTWKMGLKISVDSATMMNKGLELIEAHWLFNVPASKLDLVIHPQSIIHSMVEFDDNTIMAQMGTPDMTGPIQLAFTWPERHHNPKESLNLLQLSKLEFRDMDFQKFPCLNLAKEALKIGGTAQTVLNAANEEAVKLFLNKKIKFYDINRIIEQQLERHENFIASTIDEIITVDQAVREHIHIT